MTLNAALICLALNIYNEAGGEPLRGKELVAYVTINRVKSPIYPNDICSVVFQPYQFSWTNRGYIFNKFNEQLYNKCLTVAYRAINNNNNFIPGRLYFNTLQFGKRYKTKYKPIVVANHMVY